MLTIAQPDAHAAIKRGQPAPPVKVTTTSGQSVSLANYKGYVLILDFFASWCHPCVESIPHLVDLKKRYGKQGLQVLGLSLDEDRDDFMDLMSASRVNYPVALADEELQTNYGLRSIPLLVVIDKKGNVANIYMGLTKETTRSLETEIQKLLTE
jgi:peroxiredoxin